MRKRKYRVYTVDPNPWKRSWRTSRKQPFQGVHDFHDPRNLVKTWWQKPLPIEQIMDLDKEAEYYWEYRLFMPIVNFRLWYRNHFQVFWFVVTITVGLIGDIFF